MKTKKFLSVLLSLAMVITLALPTARSANASTMSHIASMMDVSNATANATFTLGLQQQDITADIYEYLAAVYIAGNKDKRSSSTSTSKFDPSTNSRDKEFNNAMIALGLVKQQGSSLTSFNNTDMVLTVNSDIVDNQHFTVTVNGKMAKGESAKIISIKFDSGKASIDLSSFISFVSKYTTLTSSEIRNLLEIPAGIDEITYNVTDLVNNQINDNDVTDPKDNKITLAATNAQLTTALQEIVALIVNTADSTFAKYETTTTDGKTQFKLTDEDASAFVASLGTAITNNASDIVSSITTSISKISGCETVFTNLTKDNADFTLEDMVNAVSNAGKELTAAGTSTTAPVSTGTPEKVPSEIDAYLNQQGVKFTIDLVSGITGEKGYRAYTLNGTASIYQAEDTVEKDEVPVKVDLGIDISVKEKGAAPTTAPTATPAATSQPPVTIVSKGAIIKTSNALYKVTSSDTAKTKTVTYVKPKKKTYKNISIASAITANGITFKVTAISKNACKNNKKLTKVTIGKNVKKMGSGAFMNCSSLKRVKITGKFIESIGKNAFKGTKKNLTITCPKGKLKKYKKMLKKSNVGYKKTWKIK